MAFALLLTLTLAGIGFALRQKLKEKVTNLEAARQKLVEQTELLQLVTEATRTQAGILDFRPGKETAHLSREWFTMLGYDLEEQEIPFQELMEFVHPDDLPRVLNAFQDYVDRCGRGVYEHELRLRRSDGSWCWVLTTGRAVEWDAEGRPTRLIGLDINIQNLKEAQEKMAQNEAKFRAIFENAPFAIAINRIKDGRYLDANKAFLENLGMSKSELLHMRVKDFATLSEEAVEVSQILTEKGSIRNRETVIRHLDGTTRHIIYSSILLNIQGELQALSMTVDVTERKLTEKALQENMELLRATFNATNDGILVLDKGLNVTHANRQLYRMWDISRELQKSIDEKVLQAFVLAQLEDPVGFQRTVNRLNNSQLTDKFEIPFKDGRVFESYSAPIVLAEKEEIGRLWDFRDITDRYKAAQAIDFERRQLLSVFNSINEIIYVSDPYSYEMIFANQHLKDLIGQDPTGKPCYRTLQGLDQPCDFCTNSIILSNGGRPHRWKFHNPVTEKDVAIVDQIIRWPDGREVRLEIAVDVTERERAEKALRDSEKKLRSIFAAMTDIILILDKEGRYIEVAPTNTAFLHRPPEAFRGRTLKDFFPPEQAAEFIEAICKTLAERKPVSLDYNVLIDKNTTWFSATISPLSSDQVIWVARNITNRKLAMEQLQLSEEKFSKVFAMAPDMIAITRLQDGLIIDVNNGFEDITGWEKSEVAGQKSVSDIHFWANLADRAPMVDELRAGRDVLHHAIKFRRKDGTVRFGLYSARPISISGESALIFVMQDITESQKLEAEREKLQDQLLQSQKMEAVGTLAGGVAHDFNNMLGAIMGYAELAMAELDPATPLSHHISHILDAARRSAKLTRQLLAFARKETITPEIFDLNEAVELLLKMLRRLIGENIDLAWLPGPSPCTVKLDHSQFDQVLANLCVNARDAIAGVGRITIETDLVSFDEVTCVSHAGCTPGAYVLLAISDTGCGIDKTTLNHIFEPFFTTKSVGEGTGLGLATVYGIVKQNKGFLGVYSEPGQGTTFKIYFPRHVLDGEAAVKSAGDDTPPGRGETILLVEDDPILLEMGEKMLQRLGYRVLPADTPGKALRLAEESRQEIHMFLTDVVMPEMNGRDLAERLRKIRPTIKHLFMSGYTTNIIAHQGILDRGINFIQKPFSLKGLAAKLREVLD